MAMGIVRLSSLLPQPDGSVDDAHPVGAMPLRQTWSAMRVGREAPGRFVYLGEMPIDVRFSRKSEDYGAAVHGWLRLEGKVETGAAVKSGHHWVIAEHPYAN